MPQPGHWVRPRQGLYLITFLGTPGTQAEGEGLGACRAMAWVVGLSPRVSPPPTRAIQNSRGHSLVDHKTTRAAKEALYQQSAPSTAPPPTSPGPATHPVHSSLLSHACRAKPLGRPLCPLAHSTKAAHTTLHRPLLTLSRNKHPACGPWEPQRVWPQGPPPQFLPTHPSHTSSLLSPPVPK